MRFFLEPNDGGPLQQGSFRTDVSLNSQHASRKRQMLGGQIVTVMQTAEPLKRHDLRVMTQLRDGSQVGSVFF